jgi:hypothetical protein
MAGVPRLRESRTIRSGHPAGTVIRSGLRDTMLADVPVSAVFFYERALDGERLADGLARALHHVPVFGGHTRTRDERLEIVCDDAGVPMTTFDVDETIGEAIGRVMLPSSGFVEHVDSGAGYPLLTVRLSQLADGGSVLGCSWHHGVGDMHTLALFLRAWSAFVEGTAPPEVCALEDLDAYLDKMLPPEDAGASGFRLPDAEEAAVLGREIDGALRLNRPVQIYFADAEIDRMRQALSAAAGRRLSRHDVLSGHLAAAIRELDGDTAERNLVMPVNIRRRLDIPDAIVGNLVEDLQVGCAGGASGAAIAAGIRAAIDDFSRSHLRFRASWAFLEGIGRDRFGDCFPYGFDPAGRAMVVTNWSRFGAYDVTFGGQRPAFVSPSTKLPLPWVCWLIEGFGGSGCIATVILPSRLSARLRGAEGSALLHRFREPGDALPELAGAVRKLA